MKMPVKTYDFPRTLEEAVDRLQSELPLKHKVKIARTDEDNLDDLLFALGLHVRNEFGLWTQNRTLLDSCISRVGEKRADPDLASYIIIKELWKRLRKTHALRAIR
jgi:hypothetical protein